MAKQIKQYRYYGDKAPNNYPVNLESKDLVTGSAFETRIIDLKIQAYPGTKFYLNDADDWVMVGASGEYHLGLSGNYEIAFLRFDQQCLDTYFEDNGDRNAYLIVDIVYDTTEG